MVWTHHDFTSECFPHWHISFCFRQFTKVCAARPTITLILSLIVIVAFSVGAIYLQVTTDPIELWSSKDSRARREKDYFDENFEPFYRNTQIFIRPTNTEYVWKARKKCHWNIAFSLENVFWWTLRLRTTPRTGCLHLGQHSIYHFLWTYWNYNKALKQSANLSQTDWKSIALHR